MTDPTMPPEPTPSAQPTDDATFAQDVSRFIQELRAALRDPPSALTLLATLNVVEAVAKRLAMLSARVDTVHAGALALAGVPLPVSGPTAPATSSAKRYAPSATYVKRAEEIVELHDDYLIDTCDDIDDAASVLRLAIASELQSAHDAGVAEEQARYAIGKAAHRAVAEGQAEGLARCRAVTRRIVEEIGAAGPLSLEEAVEKLLARLRDPGPGVARIAQERKRQTDTLGYSVDHDDEEHADGSLALAAVCYASPVPLAQVIYRDQSTVYQEPRPDWMERLVRLDPSVSHDRSERIVRLTKAGALIAAEIDRLLRWGSVPTVAVDEPLLVLRPARCDSPGELAKDVANVAITFPGRSANRPFRFAAVAPLATEYLVAVVRFMAPPGRVFACRELRIQTRRNQGAAVPTLFRWAVVAGDSKGNVVRPRLCGADQHVENASGEQFFLAGSCEMTAVLVLSESFLVRADATVEVRLQVKAGEPTPGVTFGGTIEVDGYWWAAEADPKGTPGS